MPERWGSVRDALAHQDVRRIEAAWGLSTASSVAATVAVLVFAYDAGGGTLVAIYGALRAAAAPATPLVIGLGDRWGLGTVLRLTLGTRVLLLVLAAAVMAFGSGALLAVVLVAASDAMAAAFRPIQAASLPWLAGSPAELTAANVTAGVMENSGTLVGSTAAALLLATADAAVVTSTAAAAAGAALISVARLQVPKLPGEPASRGAGAGVADLRRGARSMLDVAPGGGALVLAVAQTLVRGALLVLVVVLALDVLDIGESAVGWMHASIALGGLLGGAVAASVITSTRLGRGFVAGVALWGLPLVLIALVPTPVVAFVALGLVGVGNSIEDASLFTLVPRAMDMAVVTSALAFFELAIFISAGVGSLLAPVLVDLVGAENALLLLGVLLVVLAAAYLVAFARIDRAAPPPGPEIELLRSLPMFENVSLATVEHVAGLLEPHVFDQGTIVMAEGEPGTTFHLIESGRAGVTVHGVEKPTLERGDGFGEIALLRDVPRTATVRALTPLRTLALSSADFCSVLTIQQHSVVAAHEVARRRLASDPG